MPATFQITGMHSLRCGRNRRKIRKWKNLSHLAKWINFTALLTGLICHTMENGLTECTLLTYCYLQVRSSMFN